MEKVTIYVVTSGEYSDYGINAIFSTKELAEGFIKSRHGGDSYTDYGIEEYELDQDAQFIRAGYKFWGVEMLKDGTTTEVIPRTYGGDTERYILRGGNSPTLFFCYAKDEKHAVKIANERRVQLLASNLWQ